MHSAAICRRTAGCSHRPSVQVFTLAAMRLTVQIFTAHALVHILYMCDSATRLFLRLRFCRGGFACYTDASALLIELCQPATPANISRCKISTRQHLQFCLPQHTEGTCSENTHACKANSCTDRPDMHRCAAGGTQKFRQTPAAALACTEQPKCTHSPLYCTPASETLSLGDCQSMLAAKRAGRQRRRWPGAGTARAGG